MNLSSLPQHPDDDTSPRRPEERPRSDGGERVVIWLALVVFLLWMAFTAWSCAPYATAPGLPM